MGAYVLKVSLRKARPAVWRRIRVPGDATLGELHEVIQITLAWSAELPHAFRVAKKVYGPLDEDTPKVLDEDMVTLDELAGEKLTYVWGKQEYDVTVEKSVKKPTALECLGGAHALDDRAKFDIEAVNEALVDWVTSHAAPMSDEKEIEELTKTLDKALRKDPEAMVTVRARVVANLIRDLLTGAIEVK